MKIKLFATFSILLATMLVFPPELSATEADGHLVWDKLDDVWRCVGTPVDCAFTPPAE